MLSNKWTFSLKVLVLLVTVGFIATPATAGEFDVTLDMSRDIGSADGLQVARPDTTLVITVNFAQAVVLPVANVFVTTFDVDGKVTGFPAATVNPATAAKEIMVSIPVDRDDVTVNVRIAKGIVSADPINADTSKEFNQTIRLLDGDRFGGPTVYSIERADPEIPNAVTAATVRILITLSEMPKEFKAAHLDVANATAADPVAVGPIEAPSFPRIIATENVPAIRGLYDMVDGDGAVTSPGIHTAIKEDANLIASYDRYNSVLDDLAAELSALDGDAGLEIVDEAHVDLDITAVPPAVGSIANLATAAPTSNTLPYHRPLAMYTYDPDMVNPLLNIADPEDDEDVDETVDLSTLDLKVPNAGDYADAGDYTAALKRYMFLRFMQERYIYGIDVNYEYNQAVERQRQMDRNARWEATHVQEPGSVYPNPTGRDNMLHTYTVVLTPKYENKDDIVVKVKAFENSNVPIPQRYTPPLMDDYYVEGRHKLTIKVGKEILTALPSGTPLYLPHGEGAMIPASGFYLLTKNKDGSGIAYSHEKDDENKAHKQTPEQLKFNVRAEGIPNLESNLANGATIDLVAYDGTAATAAYISEVMWGSDASQADSTNSQWIEIANTTASAIAVGEKKWALWTYQPHETPPSAYTGGTLIDRLSTIRADWSLAGKGQSGRTGIEQGAADVAAIAPTQPLISMVRVTDATGAPADGSLPTSWVQSTGPSVNFKLGIEGSRIATPGAADVVRPTAPTPPTPVVITPSAVASDITITEIMVDTDNGRLPQWIELTHVGTGEVSLAGWEMVIDNAIDADVIGGGNAITVSLSGVTLDVSAHTGNTGKGQSVLVVAWAASRHSANIRADRIINIATQLNQKRQYQLLSYKGFRVTLVPPQTGAIAAFGDVAGNLDEAWELPMDEGTARSSMIRREVAGTPPTATMGTDANGWVLASSTSLITGQQSFYGSDEDAGTPGQDSGGPLPVELSHFRPARDKQTGAAVITWSTESELNNAGFFIKRSQQRNGQFKVINATMIAGAGTTSEKQFYTFTDTTAQPNVVYYYQIEDVSLDGNRQTLTLGTRLKGHVGAAGKATTTWGELKEVK